MFTGGPELIIVGIIILLLFGNRLPSVMRSLGQSVTSFKSGMADDDDTKPKESLDDKKRKES